MALKCELAGEVLHSFGSLRFKATGWSMLPTVRPGDTLVVERVRSDQIQNGDFVLVGRDRRLCAHRVVSIVEDSGTPRWITQGDALPTPDRPVKENELLGRVPYVIRAGRLIAVQPQLNVIDRWIARVIRRSVFAARAFVHVHNRRQTSEEQVLPCLG
jgi:signal peptidase I